MSTSLYAMQLTTFHSFGTECWHNCDAILWVHCHHASRILSSWCAQVALPDTGEAVALIYSYEQGLQPDGVQGRLGMQAMGPGDTYAAQCSTNTEPFWADRNQLRLGACFEPTEQRARHTVPKGPMQEVCFAFVAGTWHRPLALALCACV